MLSCLHVMHLGHLYRIIFFIILLIVHCYATTVHIPLLFRIYVSTSYPWQWLWAYWRHMHFKGDSSSRPVSVLAQLLEDYRLDLQQDNDQSFQISDFTCRYEPLPAINLVWSAAALQKLDAVNSWVGKNTPL